MMLEREGIRTSIQTAHDMWARQHSTVSVRDPRQVERASRLIERFMKRSVPSDAALLTPWWCAGCGETVEGQFASCWQCGATRLR